MLKKVLFVFAGTGVDARMSHNFIEGEKFNDDVIRVYFNGCHDQRIGGRWKLPGYLDPDLDVVANKIRKAFSRKEDCTQLSLADLKRQFGDAIIIEPKLGLEDVETIDDITLNGFSRGAVSTFATARALDDLETSISILAEDPVPGNDRETSEKEGSIYRKNFDLTKCRNISRGEVLVGTYSKHNYGWENKWFRQMAPNFNLSTDSHIFMVPKESHCEFNRRATTYSSSFLHNRGLTQRSQQWREENDRAFVIPKVEQQKFHQGIVGRAQYLPSYKMSIFKILQKEYDEDQPCPIKEDGKFKFAQSLLALHNATMQKSTFDVLKRAVLQDTAKGKGLREFIVEFDSIVQYSKAKSDLKEVHKKGVATLEQSIYQKIAEFQQIENPTRKQQEAFTQSIHAAIKLSKASLPSKVFDKLKELTTLLLKENPLVHPHLVQFIDESESFDANELVVCERALDGAVINAKELAQKLFHSSVNKRKSVFEKEKNSFQKLITNIADLASVASFLPVKQLKEALELVNDRVKSMADVLLLMKTLPTYEQQKVFYHAVEDKLADMKPTFIEIVQFMDYLSDKKCQELCKLISITKLQDIDLTHQSVKQLLTDSKIALLKKELAALPVEQAKKEDEKPENTRISTLHSEPSTTSSTRKDKQESEEEASEHSVLRF